MTATAHGLRVLGGALLATCLACGGGTASGSGAGTGAEAAPGEPVDSPVTRVHGRMRVFGFEPVGTSRGAIAAQRAYDGVLDGSRQIKICYERELARSGDFGLEGRLRVEFSILPDGRVVELSISENSVSPEVARCIANVFSSFRYTPGPTGGSARFRVFFEFAVLSVAHAPDEPDSGYVARGRGAATPMATSGQASTAPSGGHGSSGGAYRAAPASPASTAPAAPRTEPAAPRAEPAAPRATPPAPRATARTVPPVTPTPTPSGTPAAEQAVPATLPPNPTREGADALAAPEARAEFDARIVASRIRGQSSAIKRCYEVELAQNPTLRGGIRVEFTIQTDGSITGVFLSENTVSPGVGECVANVIRELRFSPGPVGGSVRYRFPFIFEPGG